MSTPKWKRERDRMYYASTRNVQAFVFGAPKPMTLWGWYVVWSLPGEKRRVGSQAWVEHSLEKAKKKALDCLQGVEAALASRDDKRGL